MYLEDRVPDIFLSTAKSPLSMPIHPIHDNYLQHCKQNEANELWRMKDLTRRKSFKFIVCVQMLDYYQLSHMKVVPECKHKVTRTGQFA
jgi:hypothetical protein